MRNKIIMLIYFIVAVAVNSKVFHFEFLPFLFGGCVFGVAFILDCILDGRIKK